jgi:CRP/FNR family transcriptional regulator, cyclic AMP receptor protein
MHCAILGVDGRSWPFVLVMPQRSGRVERHVGKILVPQAGHYLRTTQRRRPEVAGGRARSTTFRPGSPIYLPSEPAQAVFLLAQGRVKICHLTPDGKQSIIALIEPGELFGELAIYSEGSPREEFAEAADATTTVVMIPSQTIQNLMEARIDLSLGITKLIGLRRQRIERRLKNLLFHSNLERLTHLILELVEQYGVDVANGTEITIRLSHQELANIIGSTRETVTVLLGQLQREGLIKHGRKKLIVTDLAKLARIVSREPPKPVMPRSESANRRPIISERSLPK